MLVFVTATRAKVTRSKLGALRDYGPSSCSGRCAVGYWMSWTEWYVPWLPARTLIPNSSKRRKPVKKKENNPLNWIKLQMSFLYGLKNSHFCPLKLELPLVKKRQERRIRGKHMHGTPRDPCSPNTVLTFVQKLYTKICSSCFYGHFFLPIQVQKFNVIQDNI